MTHQVFTTMNGIEIFGLISICIFVTFFLITLLWVTCLKKTYVQHMENLPLEDDQTEATSTPNTHDHE